MILHKKNYEIISEELERIISSGIIKPGAKLETIENLARQYQVGRSTIREALSHLKAKGLIETKQGGGTFVLQHPLQRLDAHLLAHKNDLLQVLQVRKILEVGGIELAALNRTEENLDELDRIIHQMKDAVGNEEISQLYDVNFHLAIARATQNPLLESMMESISSAMNRTMRETRKLWLYSEWETAERLFQQHREMAEAIRRQDRLAAVETMRMHLNKIESVLRSPNAEQ